MGSFMFIATDLECSTKHIAKDFHTYGCIGGNGFEKLVRIAQVGGKAFGRLKGKKML